MFQNQVVEKLEASFGLTHLEGIPQKMNGRPSNDGWRLQPNFAAEPRCENQLHIPFPLHYLPRPG
ncbi:MAG: hypothetical protein C4316_11405 [Chloroflexota bacterium]